MPDTHYDGNRYLCHVFHLVGCHSMQHLARLVQMNQTRVWSYGQEARLTHEGIEYLRRRHEVDMIQVRIVVTSSRKIDGVRDLSRLFPPPSIFDIQISPNTSDQGGADSLRRKSGSIESRSEWKAILEGTTDSQDDVALSDDEW